MPPTTARDPMIRVEELTARYGDTTIFDAIGFEVARGAVFVILGGSGSGKSTLLKHMIGLYRPARGKILIDGRDIVTARGAERRRIIRTFGVTYQSGALFGSLSLLENVRLPLEEFTALPTDAIDRIARTKLRLVGLDGFGEHYPSELSGGMQKRAAIARAMSLDPKVLFLDEPSAGLDPVTAADLDQLILGLSGDLGMTFVVVTHELASIETIASQVIMLDKRTRGIIARGTPRHIRETCTDPWVQRFFAPRQQATAATGEERR